MPEEFTGKSADLKAWMLLHRARDLAFYCQDRICSEYGLTVEQYTVLVAVKYLDDPVRPTDIGRWGGHKVNTVSMLADRMVKAGLLKRIRDLPDRREARLVITKKGEEAFRLATPAVWSFVQDTMSSLSDEEKRTLARLLEKVRDKALEHLAADADIRRPGAYDTIDPARLTKRLGKYSPSPASVANRPGAVSRGPAAPGSRPTRARSATQRGHKGESY